jgi:hypothetical protein
MTMRRYLHLLWSLLLAWPLSAHEGPPFAILVDRPLGPYVVSVWSDPDIGTGTFFVVLEPKKGAPFTKPASVRVGVQPVTGRLAEAVYDAEPERVRYGARHSAKVPLDRGEMWQVRILVAGPAGGGVLTTAVEATPPGGLGWIELVIYLLPFLAVGFLWGKAVLRRRGRPRTQRS